MGEESGFLEDIADPPSVLWDEYAATRVNQHPAVDGHLPPIGTEQSADEVDERGLARPRAAKEGGQPAGGDKTRVEGEGPEPAENVDLDTHSQLTYRVNRLRGKN